MTFVHFQSCITCTVGRYLAAVLVLACNGFWSFSIYVVVDELHGRFYCCCQWLFIGPVFPWSPWVSRWVNVGFISQLGISGAKIHITTPNRHSTEGIGPLVMWSWCCWWILDAYAGVQTVYVTCCESWNYQSVLCCLVVRSCFGNINFFGGPSPTSVKASTKLQQLESSNDDAMFVFLSDVWLDDIKVRHAAVVSCYFMQYIHGIVD